MKKVKNFCLIGASGFVAPKHMVAIKETKNNLIACSDPHQNIGIIDKYFPESEFFIDSKKFSNFVKKNNKKIDYLTVCTPNYLHYQHIKLGIENNINVICEKPLVLDPRQLDLLQNLNNNQKIISTILQLRIHPNIIKLKQYLLSTGKNIHDVELTYMTPRGNWYHSTWKTEVKKSGGLVTNIGIHLFDLLVWLFGDVESSKLFIKNDSCNSGFLRLKKANIKWFLSIDKNHVALENKKALSIRNLKINNKNFDLSKGFTNLHLKSYQDIISNKGFSIEDTRSSIILVDSIKKQKISNYKLNDYHRLIKKI